VKFLLDTDHISIWQGRSGAEYAVLVNHLAQHPTADVVLCIISFHEQAVGCHALINRARNALELQRGYDLLQRVLAGFSAAPVLAFDAAAGVTFDRLRANRVRISTMDLRIAAVALSRGLVVVTRNVSDFTKVPGLVTEDWTK
jgi:tRNA(fMet)-specific endonuclease VapC